ncbi:ZYBA0S11-00188g1_1 [Zygosaccharomyces bailii CLIB 213]|uniref:tRNA-dihydrouridine(20) synthase [NAD(P)+] n=1 Tax=Zygosaccharomyces bailii (strain CLIB 213 / ATCC 58445 / CBS 680 / BCRC 21525 / NBRC 1098 / NCYC 1416 / NRRL Y-2227) TaxID=1333698 RepID=A0A8J2TAB1_ZYGB2|nr:ZYBA0S11-00188g1_1 [Zygosaccharomyces bailii CLIB 213]
MVSYAGKLVLAPMVRAGELPTRLLALKYGADLVWSPEIIDKKLIKCERQVNDKLGCVDYVKADASSPVFRTCPSLERGKIIFQIGTATPSLALEAALKVVQDVDGIDINAGCPKHFSVHSGMGAALLKTPDTLCAILTALVDKVGKPYQKPISVKIRLLETKETTLQLVKRLCETGISHLTVHCRTTPMRNRERPIRDYIKQIYEICQDHDVTLIMNGGIQSKSHFEELLRDLELPREIGGMMADCAEQNPTAFHDVPLDWYDVARKYVTIAHAYDNHVGNTKYMLSRIVPGKSKFYQYFARCKTTQEIEHVLKLLGPDGNPLGDPLLFIQGCREQEKLAKQRASELKSEQRQAEKRFASQQMMEPKKAKT